MALFEPGDVVSLPAWPGVAWTIDSWPPNDVGTFVYHMFDDNGIRTSGSGFTGIAHPNYVYDDKGDLVHDKGERVEEIITPRLIRKGILPINTLHVNDDVLAALSQEEAAEEVANLTGLPVMTADELRESKEAMEHVDRVVVNVGDTVEVIMRGVVSDVEAQSNNWSFGIKYGDSIHNQMKYWINQAHSNIYEVRVLSHSWAVGDVITPEQDLSSLPSGALGVYEGTHLIWCQDHSWRGTTDSITTVKPDRLTLVYVPAAT